MTDREQFLEERKGAIGGSDVADLLDLAPFGCERKLWYDKKGIPEDFPNELDENPNIRRGTVLEDIAIAEFCKEHDYVDPFGKAPPQAVHPDHQVIAAHADRLLVKRGGTTHEANETKIPRRDIFDQVKASGQPFESWVAQNRWTMFAYRLKRGVINMFSPDAWQAVKFEIIADKGMEEQFVQVAEMFWSQLTINPDNIFPVKAEDYPGCRRCPWRRTCRGMGRIAAVAADQDDLKDVAARQWIEDNSVEPLIIAYLEAQAEFATAQAFLEQRKQALDDALQGRSIVTRSGYRAWWQTKILNFKSQPAKAAEQKSRRSLKVIEP